MCFDTAIYIYIYGKLGFYNGGQVEGLKKKKRDFVAFPDHMYYFHWEIKTVKFAKTTLYHVSNTNDAKQICLKENFRRKCCCSVLTINSRHEFIFVVGYK